MNQQEKFKFPFDTSPSIPDIEGLGYFPDFISTGLHDRLIKTIDGQAWEHRLKRRVQQYGYRYDYKNRSLCSSDRLGPLPRWTSQTVQLMIERDALVFPPDQMIVNEYLPGQGISSHIDQTDCFDDTIAIISLGSQAIMKFAHADSQETVSVLLEPCSLLLLSKAARYEWKHGIPARKSDRIQGNQLQRKRRISLTFRTVLHAN